MVFVLLGGRPCQSQWPAADGEGGGAPRWPGAVRPGVPQAARRAAAVPGGPPEGRRGPAPPRGLDAADGGRPGRRWGLCDVGGGEARGYEAGSSEARTGV